MCNILFRNNSDILFLFVIVTFGFSVFILMSRVAVVALCLSETFVIYIHCVAKNDTDLACYNLDLHLPILMIFGRDVDKKVKSKVVICFFTLPS